MSLCPYGVQAGNGIIPAVRSLAGFVELNLNFIGGQIPNPLGMPSFTALGGEPETAENIRQVCALKLAEKKAMEYILERNKAVKSPDWKGAAAAAGLAPELIAKIEECSTGPQGAAWYSKSIEMSQARAANSSPTIDIAGKPYTGGRSMPAITRALCDALKPIFPEGTPLPEACTDPLILAASANEPAAANADCAAGGQKAGAGPVTFNITVATEENCKICAPTLLGNLALLHSKATIRTVDAGSKEGRELIKLHGAKTLPLYVLESKVEKDTDFPRLLPVAYYKSGDSYLIRHGPHNFFPTVWLERARRPRHLDVFLEGLSGPSTLAQQDLIRFMLAESKALGSLTISLHFVTREETVPAKVAVHSAPDAAPRTASISELDGAPGELFSPRGEAEIAEDTRQICLFQHAPLGAYIRYLECLSSVPDAESVPKCVPSGFEDVKSCIAGKEGQDLLRKDARLAVALNITSPPVFLWENRYGPFDWNKTDWRALLLGRKETADKTAKSAPR